LPGSTVDPEVLAALAVAVANRERVELRYQAHDGTPSRRAVEPDRLVPDGRRWYLLAFDLDRDDWRVFRVDRVRDPRLTGLRATPRTLPDEDAAAFVIRRMHGLAPTYRAVATLHASAVQVAARLGDAGELEPIDARRCHYRSDPDTLDWLAFRLALLGCEFEVHEPPELIEHLRALAARLTRALP
jgi:predicted DNA-binding transcriptional regulator YafY